MNEFILLKYKVLENCRIPFLVLCYTVNASAKF